MKTTSSLRGFLGIGLLLLAAAVAGCGEDDPVSFSAPIGINVKVKEKDGTLSAEKGITTESSNPWGKFVSDAQQKIGGDPSDIDLERLTMLLSTTTVGATELSGVFDGTVDVQFLMNDSNNVYPVGSGSVTATTSGRELEMSESFDYGRVSADDVTRMMSGSFKVVVAGPAAAGFPVDDEADLQLTLTFSAFE